jgi:hypothetical protein
MLYVILFALATFLNLALALAFGTIGAVGLGFVAIFAAFVSMAAMFVTMFAYH